MRKYLLPEKGTFYKANLHCHATFSDGANYRQNSNTRLFPDIQQRIPTCRIQDISRDNSYHV